MPGFHSISRLTLGTAKDSLVAERHLEAKQSIECVLTVGLVAHHAALSGGLINENRWQDSIRMIGNRDKGDTCPDDKHNVIWWRVS